MIVVYTAVLGVTDPLHEPVARGSARFVCFTDQPIQSDGWEIVRVAPTDTPTREARRLKCLPHTLFPDTITIWQDASFELLTAPDELVELYPGPITCFRHPDRTRITQETAKIIQVGKARATAVQAQLREYQRHGFDTGRNRMTELSCTGVVMRRNTIALDEAWWQQVSTHTLRDQMSLDYVAWRLGVQIDRWAGTGPGRATKQLGFSPHFRYTGYRRPVNDF